MRIVRALLVCVAAPAAAFDFNYGSSHWRQPGAQREAVEGRRSSGGDSSSSGAPSAPAETPQQVKYRSDRRAAVEAHNRGDLRAALAGYREMQKHRYDPRVAAAINEIEASFQAQDADEAIRRQDYARAVELWKAAQAKWPEVLNENGRREFARWNKWVGDRKLEDERTRAKEAAAQAARPEADRLLRESAALLLKKDYKAALEAARKSVDLVGRDKTNMAVLLNAQAGERMEQGDLGAAIQSLEQLLVWDAENAEAKRALAALRTKRDEQRALLAASMEGVGARLESAARAAPRVEGASIAELAAAVESITGSPGAAEARRGFEAIARGDWNAAEALYKQALLKDPANPELRRSAELCEHTADRARRFDPARDWAKIKSPPPGAAAALRLARPRPSVPRRQNSVFDMEYASQQFAIDAAGRAMVAMLVHRDRDAAVAEMLEAHALDPDEPVWRDTLIGWGWKPPPPNLLPTDEDLEFLFP